MKTTLIRLLASFTLIATALPAMAHEKIAAGPNGGRLLTAVEPHAEFLVTSDRKVQITFIGEDGRPIPPTTQVVTVTAGDRSAPTKLSFTVSAHTLISDKPLPDATSIPTVVQIKTSPEAKTVVEKFNVNLALCPECKLQEYACTCTH